MLKSGKAAQIRQAACLSRSEMALLVGVTENCLYRWESGDRHPYPELAIRYLDVLEKLAGEP